MRRFLLLPLLGLGLCAQSPMASLIRQPKATLVEFTAPFTEFQIKSDQADVRVHVGAGLGLRRWNGGDTAVRFVGDANALINQFFVGTALVVELPPGEKAMIGPRLRMGWAFHSHFALSLEGEHLERPFGDGLGPKQRSSLGLALTYRF